MTDNASAHFEQPRFEKEVQKQEYGKNPAELIADKEDLRKKANDCWEEQNDAKEELKKQLMDVQTEQESNRLRHAQEKAGHAQE